MTTKFIELEGQLVDSLSLRFHYPWPSWLAGKLVFKVDSVESKVHSVDSAKLMSLLPSERVEKKVTIFDLGLGFRVCRRLLVRPSSSSEPPSRIAWHGGSSHLVVGSSHRVSGLHHSRYKFSSIQLLLHAIPPLCCCLLSLCCCD